MSRTIVQFENDEAVAVGGGSESLFETWLTLNPDGTIEEFLQAMRGPGGGDISSDPSNRIEIRPDGLFVGPPQLTSEQW